MTQGGQRPTQGATAGGAPAAVRVAPRSLGGASIPPSARPSAEHVRALEAAGLLEVRLLKKSVQRPLMSVWVGESRSHEQVLLTVVDACGTPAERRRVMSGAKALSVLSGTAGVQSVRRVLEDVDAFVADFHGAGTAADLVVLRWPTLRKLDFVCRVSDALVELHAAGVVHGCLCPDNILLDDELHPVVTEAGLVSIAESLEGDAENFFGYGAYAAPEAARGTPDARSDVFSVGRLLTFVMLDRTPGETVDVMDVNAKDPGVAAIVRRCTGPAVDRYESMAALAAELHKCRQKLVPRDDDGSRRPEAEVEAPVRPARAPSAAGSSSGTAARPGLKAAARPAAWSAAPWWVAAGSLGVIVLCLSLSQVVSLRSDAVHTALVSLVTLATVTLTTSIPATTLVRVGLAALGLAVALAVDPVGRLSQLDADDAATRGAAARTFVQKGGKDLRGMRLQEADLSALDLTGATLEKADLTSTILARSKLSGAHVDGASFVMTHLEGADLTGVALDRAFAIETATCDDGTVLPADWYCGAAHTVRRGTPPPAR